MSRLDNDKKRLIRNHANRNVAHLLDKLGVEYYDGGYGLIQACCPCGQHGGDRDNHTAWSWRVDLGKWVCWSHHCEEDRGNDIFGLVSSIRRTGFTETVEWISSILAARSIDLNEEVADPDSLHRGVQLHIHEALSEDNLKFLQPDPQYLLNRGFDLDVLREYQVGLWTRPGTYMEGRVVFPVRDHEGHLVGYTGRTIYSREEFERRGVKYKKWVHGRHYNLWPQRGDIFTSSILFNLHRAKRYINPHGRLILLEGPTDGMKLEEARIHNWGATLGTSFCHAHRTLLIKAGVRKIFVAYDNDDPNKYANKKSPGEKGWERLQRIVGDLLELERVPLPAGKDCGDLDTPLLRDIFRDIAC